MQALGSWDLSLNKKGKRVSGVGIAKCFNSDAGVHSIQKNGWFNYDLDILLLLVNTIINSIYNIGKATDGIWSRMYIVKIYSTKT